MRTVMRSFRLLALILVGIGANAQSQLKIKVNVPFTFTAAGKDLPAGEYHVFFNASNSLLCLQRANSTVYIMSTASNPTQDGRPFLRFYRYGQDRILQDVSIAGTVRRVPSAHRGKLLSADPTQPKDRALGAVATPALLTLTAEGEQN